MKKIILCSSILMLLLTKIINAQSTTQTFPIINLYIAPGYDRPIEDFYGLNGQNTLSATSMYANTNVNSGLAASYASYLRYPGGTVANYWDWQEGWFFRNMEKNGALSLDIDLQNKDRLQDVFNTGSGLLNENGSNYINDFINTLGNTGTKPLFVVNPLTSDLNYQIAMLLEAKLQNLEVKRVEIGNEFYLSNVGYQERFATAQDYANLTTTWRNEIRNYLGNDMQICAVGSNNDYTGSSNNRRDTWNTNLFNSISGSLPEAFSIHHYRNALPPSTTTFSSQTFFKKAIDDFNELNNYIYQFGGSTSNTTPIWLTEYNLFDREIPIHGKWYHGLYTAFNTLKFLENKRIKVCNLHAQSGNYTFGNFFNTTDGLKKIGAFDACSASVPTALYGKTSEGIAMEQIAIALKDAEQGKRIAFNAVNGATIPTLNLPPNAEQALYGWAFDKYGVINNSVVILNLSGDPISNVNVDQLGFNTQDISIQLSLSTPDYYATGFSRSNGSTTEYEFLTCGSNSNTFANSMSFAPVNIPSSKLITLPPYSITRLEKINNQRLYLYALNDTVKAGSKVIVSLLNKDSIQYNWGNGNDSTAYIEFYPTQDTTITLTYTIPGSFTSSTVTKSIKVTPTPVTVSILAPSNLDYCPGTPPITLTASPGGGVPNPNYKFVWITTPTNDDFPDFNKGVGNTATINVSPDFPTTYTVYVTDGETVAKASITINVPTAFNLEPSYTSCNRVPIPIEISNLSHSGTSFQFNWQNSTSSILGPPFVFSIHPPNGSVSDILTVTATNSGCTTTKTASVNFYNCCNTISSLQIEPGSDINDLFDFFDSNNTLFTTEKNSDGQLKVTSLGAANSTHFIVNGDLHIRDDASSAVFYTGLELINANVTFTEGASITVEPGFSLTLNNSNLDAECDEMWKGIIVDAGRFTSTADVAKNSSINNAEVAVNSFPGSNLNIRRTSFENNIIGIEADHQSADGDNLQFLNIRANEFRGAGTSLRNTYVGQLLPRGNVPLAGIKLDQVAAVIGNANATSNLFSNLNCGIIAYRSALNITNANFLNIASDLNYISLNECFGAAIYASNQNNSGYSKLNFNGSYSRPQIASTIDNCTNGIISDGTDLSVINSIINNVQFGIYAASNIESMIDISNNYISSSVSCIDLMGNDLSPFIDVSQNNLNPSNQNDPSSAHGIRVFEMNNRRYNDGKNFNIRCNLINMNYSENGIKLLNADYVNLTENAVFQNYQDVNYYAFNSTNSNFCFFDHNTAMLDPNNPFSINNGFLFSNCKDNKIFGNSVKNTRLGFEFLGGCGSTDFIQNNMENHFLGLYLNDLTIIDDQIDKGNRWLNLNGAIGAQNDAWNSFPSSSLFLVNGNQGTEFEPSTPNTNTGWFSSSPNLAPVSGITLSDCKIGERYIPFIIEKSDMLTMQRVAFDSVFYDESLTNASKLLFEKFSLYDSVLYSLPLYTNYVDSLKTKSSGKLSTTRLKLGDKSIYSNGFSFEPDQLGLNNILDSLLVSDSSNIVNYTLETYNAFKKLNVTYKFFSQDLKNYLDQVKIENNSIAPVTIVNENEKKINTILAAHYLKTNANFTLDERNRIENIAYQCPREGGASVYRARTLMNSINPYAVYNDDVQCNAIFVRKGKVQKTNEQQLVLKPNKLGNELKFESNINLEGKYQVKVFDVLGKELLERSIQVKSTTFLLPFNFTENSIYFITVASNNLQSFNFKLIW